MSRLELFLNALHACLRACKCCGDVLDCDRLWLVLDVQVGRLLHSLNIDPRSLPGRADAAAWDSIYQEGASRFSLPLAADVAANAQLGHAAGAANGCVSAPQYGAFSNISLCYTGTVNTSHNVSAWFSGGWTTFLGCAWMVALPTSNGHRILCSSKSSTLRGGRHPGIRFGMTQQGPLTSGPLSSARQRRPRCCPLVPWL